MRKYAYLLAWLLLVPVAFTQPAQQGATIFQQCQGCHQPGGTGIPGVFPPLAGHVPEILAAKGGREYIINMLLYGLTGQINVKGGSYNGAMPAFGAQLKDDQIAAVLNYVSTSWGNKNPKAFTANEVKAQRAKKLTSAQVYELRKKLGLK